LAELQDTDYGTDLLESIWNAMDNPNEYGGITVKGGYTVEKVLQQLFEDWYNIHYVVKSGNDTIEEMSPGKKALVLLELLISLEDSKCPILIDQPEDDLDNRSIYYDLVQFIRRRKEERQIIIVTHNANVVLGADAEEVIIANQNGKDTENFSARFEYRSGAIENDEVLKDEAGEVLAGILNKSGIQTQICDILEGGKTAFQLRQNKYAVIAQ
jgi:ABC-type cobalamin/Fe3+-siderophores transport system ATPase subunit